MTQTVATVRVKRNYQDIELKRRVVIGEQIDVTYDRAKKLVGMGLVSIIKMFTVEDIKNPVPDKIVKASVAADATPEAETVVGNDTNDTTIDKPEAKTTAFKSEPTAPVKRRARKVKK